MTGCILHPNTVHIDPTAAARWLYCHWCNDAWIIGVKEMMTPICRKSSYSTWWSLIASSAFVSINHWSVTHGQGMPCVYLFCNGMYDIWPQELWSWTTTLVYNRKDVSMIRWFNVISLLYIYKQHSAWMQYKLMRLGTFSMFWWKRKYCWYFITPKHRCFLKIIIKHHKHYFRYL